MMDEVGNTAFTGEQLPAEPPEQGDEEAKETSDGARFDLNAVRIVGISRRICGKSKERIGLASAFYAELEENGVIAALDALPRKDYSGILCVSYDFSKQGFTRLIGVNTDVEPPEGMELYTLEAGKYARFECKNNEADINEMWNHIYFTWCAQGEFIHSGGAELEQLDGENAALYVPVMRRPVKEPVEKPNMLKNILPILIGAALGLFVGNMFDKMPLGMLIGVAAGMVFAMRKKKDKKE